jgi:hypothetical protein
MEAFLIIVCHPDAMRHILLHFQMIVFAGALMRLHLDDCPFFVPTILEIALCKF